MKILIYLLIALSLGVIVYNFTLLDYDNLLKGDSSIAAIGIVAAICVIVMMCILLVSKAIEKKSQR